ncbi:TetR/AcrR family transcriptional regulator [Actinomadura vinacea]|uniref:TetR/AcrR family transcriptional regulator n=1 Tax=Actinomadura vinacea TaxID=115336 RepID=UPI0031E3482A
MGFEGFDGEAEARLRKTALQLFASLGYDSTTTDMLVEAAGVDHGTVLKAGGKSGLYRATMEYTNDLLTRATREALARVKPDVDGLHQLVDYQLDFYFEHPEVLFLWAHRSLSDAADLTDIEERYSAPLHDLLEEAFDGTQLLDRTEYRLTANVFNWCLRGFMIGGVHLLDGSVLGPDDPGLRDAFRAYMHRLLDAMRPAGGY